MQGNHHRPWLPNVRPKGVLGRKVLGNFTSKSTHFIKVRKKKTKDRNWRFLPPPHFASANSLLGPDSTMAYSDLTGAKGRNHVSKPLPEFPDTAPPIQLLRPSTLSSLTLYTWCSEKSQTPPSKYIQTQPYLTTSRASP